VTFESVVRFKCHDEELLGILHHAATPSKSVFVFVVGGPQYRVGSHRMFVHMARNLCSLGFSVFRFDCRGMGDSSGDFISFENIESDIRCAIDAALAATSCDTIILLGLCDGATACALYAPLDERVIGLVLLNPWVRTEQVQSGVLVKHYYLSRLKEPGFWREIWRGEADILGSLRGFIQSLVGWAREAGSGERPQNFVERMRQQLIAFPNSVRIVISGRDLTAQEFLEVSRSPAWQPLIESSKVDIKSLPNADHTFSGEGDMENLLAVISTNY
jgi:exosortase A-associated hydrolase 1